MSASMSGGVSTRERRNGLALAAAVIAMTALAVCCDRRSSLARRLSEREPVAGLLALSAEGRPESPALYLLLYGPSRGTLDLAALPAATRAAALGLLRAGPLKDALREPFWLEAKLPAGAQPADPFELKSRLMAWSRGPSLWPGRGKRSDLGAYDAFLLAWALRRLAPARVRLSLFPEDGSADALAQRLLARARGLAEGRAPAEITVEVLNASGRDGLAWRATRILRAKGFDVSHFGNAETPGAKMTVLDRLGRPKAASAALRALGCRGLEALSAPQEHPRAAVTLILGQDFARCAGLAPPGQGRD